MGDRNGKKSSFNSEPYYPPPSLHNLFTLMQIQFVGHCSCSPSLGNILYFHMKCINKINSNMKTTFIEIFMVIQGETIFFSGFDDTLSFIIKHQTNRTRSYDFVTTSRLEAKQKISFLVFLWLWFKYTRYCTLLLLWHLFYFI